MNDLATTEASDAPIDLPAAPLASGRIDSLDFIRGIAVLGILCANIVAFGQPFEAYMYPPAFVTPADDPGGWLWIAQFVLIDNKMRGLFTLLFGAGMYLFMEKAWARGSGRWLQARRLFWLMCFGLIHFFLIWRGDILFLYSIAGFAALACLRWTAKTQLVVGLIGYIAGALLFLGAMGIAPFVANGTLGQEPAFAEMQAGLEEGKAQQFEDTAAETGILTHGSYGAFVRHNFTAHASDLLFTLLMFIFETLPLMLVGMGLYRLGLWSGGMDPRKQRKWGWIGVVGGSLLTLGVALWVKSDGFSYYGTLTAFTAYSKLPVLPVTLGLAALLALWGNSAKGWLAERFSAAGRAAFTNYLGTSLLMLLVFHPWAGGLWGALNRPQLYLVVLGAWIVMLAWSKPWLEHFRYGPLEWLWRCLTYWRLFPLKR